MARPETSVQGLSDALHRALAGVDAGRCWLIIDPSVRPLQKADELAVSLRAGSIAATRVPAPDKRLRAEELPHLVPLDSERTEGSAVLLSSLHEAIAELDATTLRQGAGRRICGWIQSSASTDETARHIGRQMIQRRPGHTTLLRWVDPAALWAFWPILDRAQQAALLGPIHTYHLLDPAGSLFTLNAEHTAPGMGPTSLGLEPEQWADADAIGALNAALRRWGAQQAESAALGVARQAGIAAMRRARSRGFDREVDLASYAHHAIADAANFDMHLLVQQHLDAAEPGAYLDALLDDLSADDWQRIRLESPPKPA